MTINGGELCPPPTPPKNDFKTLGKVEKGKPPFPKSVIPRSASDGGSPIFEEGKFPSSSSTHKVFKVFSGVSWEGVFFPFPILGDPSQKAFGMTLRAG
jgi:hypothetical protein